MNHVQELKHLRDSALGRLQQNPDYRMLRSLTSLIDELTLLGGGQERKDIGQILKGEDVSLEEPAEVLASEDPAPAEKKGKQDKVPEKPNGRLTNYASVGNA